MGAPSLQGQVPRHRLGIAPVATDLSCNYPGHEARLQEHEDRVARYFRDRPCAAGAEPFGGRRTKRGPERKLSHLQLSATEAD